MTSIHKKMVKNAIKLLKQKGFKENQIIEEYSVVEGKTWIVIDVVGISEKNKVAIEVGNMGKNRIEKLKKYFNEVLHFPYGKSIGKGKYKCLVCNYVWKTRVTNPKSCPRCKVRIDK